MDSQTNKSEMLAYIISGFENCKCKDEPDYIMLSDSTTTDIKKGSKYYDDASKIIMKHIGMEKTEASITLTIDENNETSIACNCASNKLSIKDPTGKDADADFDIGQKEGFCISIKPDKRITPRLIDMYSEIIESIKLKSDGLYSESSIKSVSASMSYSKDGQISIENIRVAANLSEYSHVAYAILGGMLKATLFVTESGRVVREILEPEKDDLKRALGQSWSKTYACSDLRDASTATYSFHVYQYRDSKGIITLKDAESMVLEELSKIKESKSKQIDGYISAGSPKNGKAAKSAKNKPGDAKKGSEPNGKPK